MNRQIVKFIASTTLVVCAGFISMISQTSRTIESPEYTAGKVGYDCKTNKCSSSGASGCSSCVDVTVLLPLNAWVTKTHCYTNANFPTDYPPHGLHEVDCGSDVSWSVFDTPEVFVTSSSVVVRTTYHNRSSDRSRDVQLKVDWEPRTDSTTHQP